MPSLDSLPPPATIGAFNLNKINNNRWSKLPNSQNIQMELITRSKHNYTNTDENLDRNDLKTELLNKQQLPRIILKKNDYLDIGELLGQEQLTGSSQVLCHYKNNSLISSSTKSSKIHQPISLICQLGCCQHILGGCCILEDNELNNSSSTFSSSTTQNLVSYHWALALLFAFIICVFASTLAMLVLYWINRKRNAQTRRQLMLTKKCSLGIIDSSTASQQSGSSYGAPSLIESTITNGQQTFYNENNLNNIGNSFNLQQQQNKYFRNLYIPTSPNSLISSSEERHRSIGGYLETPQNLLKPYQVGRRLPRHLNNNLSISPTISNNSVYPTQNEF
ncbi:hypothetical protein Mgra_00008765 [Meloidogyne graminicola]|uniref:CX domain-containing protein n=1 Tax=Meloidogyne graminicola TaxID=189291 RepID=A0A8S9ZES5_9BILA|nr:hypothetical protein Mgra_00008765 [Meloidogyne graminicola]